MGRVADRAEAEQVKFLTPVLAWASATRDAVWIYCDTVRLYVPDAAFMQHGKHGSHTLPAVIQVRMC